MFNRGLYMTSTYGEGVNLGAVTEMPFSNNPYIRALQAANRIGLMGVRIEDIQRTFPLGAVDVLCVALELEELATSSPGQEQNLITE